MSNPELEKSPETAEPADEVGGNALLELAKHFKLEESEAEPAETPSTEEKAKPSTLNALAERLGIEVKDLYDLEIPSSREGEKFTLGQLKDHMVEREEFTVSKLKFEEDRARKESELIRAQTELTELFSAIPDSAKKPEILEKVREKHRAILERERKATLDVIPDWRDESVMESDITAMEDYMKGYGFPAGYLKTVYDHRTMRFIREAWRREERLRKALDMVTEKKPAAIGTSKPGKPARQTSEQRRQTRHEQQVGRYLKVLNTPKG